MAVSWQVVSGFDSSRSADATRLRMVGLMVDHSRSGQELASILGVSPPTVSHHLRTSLRSR